MLIVTTLYLLLLVFAVATVVAAAPGIPHHSDLCGPVRGVVF